MMGCRGKSRHAGLILMEVMMGLSLLAGLIFVLAVSMGTYHRGMKRLADRRAAIHLAELTLTQMAEGAPTSAPGRNTDQDSGGATSGIGLRPAGTPMGSSVRGLCRRGSCADWLGSVELKPGDQAMTWNRCCCRRAHGRSHGFTLVEMMGVVALAGAFAALAGEAFVTIASVTRDSNRVQTTEVRLDVAIRKLRADVWRARSIQTPDDSNVVLEFARGQSVMWGFAHDGTTLLRVEMKTEFPLRWRPGTGTGSNVPIRFSTRDGALMVSSKRQDSGITDELVLVSQVSLAACAESSNEKPFAPGRRIFAHGSGGHDRLRRGGHGGARSSNFVSEGPGGRELASRRPRSASCCSPGRCMPRMISIGPVSRRDFATTMNISIGLGV